MLFSFVNIDLLTPFFLFENLHLLWFNILLFSFDFLPRPISINYYIQLLLSTYILFLSLLPWLLRRPPRLAPTARLLIQALIARDSVRTVDRLGSVVVAVNHLPPLNMLDAPHVVVLDVRNLNQVPSCLNQLPNSLNQLPSHLNQLPNCLNQLPSYLNQLPNYLNQLPSYLNQVPSSLNLPESVEIVVHYSLLLDMFDALHVVVPLLRDPNQVPSRLGTVTNAVHHLLLQRRDMLDALHAVVVPNISPNQVPFMLFPSCQSVPFLLLFLHHKVSPNVILAAFRCHLATISPAVWNAEIAEGTCRTDLRHWLLGHVGPNGVPSNLAAWTSSVPTVAPFIGMPR